MKSGNFKIKQNMQYGANKLMQAIIYPFNQALRAIKRKLNPNGFVNAVVNDVRKQMNDVIQSKPASIRDYYGIGRYYAAKKLVYLSAVVFLLLLIFLLRFGFPWVQSTFFTNTMVVNSADMFNYSGKVKLKAEKSGPVIFKGRLMDGRINGDGTLYNLDGTLLYHGGFLMEMYSGYGELYYPGGNAHYKGNFELNQYQGQGYLYFENGNPQYEGAFAAGLYEGMGNLYRENGMLRRFCGRII